jgi:FXSXX-COOH protein
MDSSTGDQFGDEPLACDLVDVTNMPLARLLPADDSALANCLRRLLADLDRPQETLAGFGNVPR